MASSTEWGRKNRERSREYQRAWRLRNPDKVRQYMRDVNLKAYRYRDEVLRRYGARCQTCGFSDVRALQLDHVRGGGCQERHRLGTATIYKDALKRVGDGTYQLLCANCNWIKRIEAGEVKLHRMEGGAGVEPASLVSQTSGSPLALPPQKWSGWEDLNLRSPSSKLGGFPGFPTPCSYHSAGPKPIAALDPGMGPMSSLPWQRVQSRA